MKIDENLISTFEADFSGVDSKGSKEKVRVVVEGR